MRLDSPRPLFAPLALAVLVACQRAPLPPSSADATTPPAPGQPTTVAAPPTAAATLPAGEQVALGPINDLAVLVDQVGYLPAYPKVALVTDVAATTFHVVNVQNSRSVYTATLSEPTHDPDTGLTLRRADFSGLDAPGTYSVVVPGVGRSPEFRIAADVYRQLSSDVLNSYDQLAVLAPTTWQTATAADRKTGQVMDITGGWPDAGDYGRYMPSAASAVGTLLLLDDAFPQRTNAEQLQVLRRELDWMLKMQRADGAVYHKVTPLNFGGFDKGSDNIGGPLFVFDPNTADAGVFAAVMAQAAHLYSPVDQMYAERLLAAATRSWGWLQDNPKPILPPDTEGTGAYVYSRDSTQRLWAAAELFKSTGDRTYADYVQAYLDQHAPSIEPLGWSNPETYALLAIVYNDAADAGLRQQIVQRLSRWADGMATTVTSPADPWTVSISSFHWASNKTSLDNAVLLLIANSVAPNPRYVEAALDQLHYVLGRNALAKSFITGYGANSVNNPHNRTMATLGRIVPGVLVGGPNSDGQDGVTPPAQGERSYVDVLQAYASNENSVEYNAPLAFVTALFSATN